MSATPSGDFQRGQHLQPALVGVPRFSAFKRRAGVAVQPDATHVRAALVAELPGGFFVQTQQVNGMRRVVDKGRRVNA